MNRESLIEQLNEALKKYAQAFRRAGIKIPEVKDKQKVKLSDYSFASKWLQEFIKEHAYKFQKTCDIYNSFVIWDTLLNDPISRTNQECLLYIQQRKSLRLEWFKRPGVFRNASRPKKNCTRSGGKNPKKQHSNTNLT